MWELRLYIIQRLTAAVLAPLILIHLGMIFYATRTGISAGQILSRTEGSLGWALFYGLFVLMASLHGAIGIRTVLREWTAMRGPGLNAAMAVIALLLFILGMRAVAAVTAPGSMPL